MPQKERAKNNPDDRPISEAVGAGDSTSGGGAGSGTPDPDTAMRAPEAAAGPDPKQDRDRIFPERGGKEQAVPHGQPPKK